MDNFVTVANAEKGTFSNYFVLDEGMKDALRVALSNIITLDVGF